ncbi:DUF4810 domain-containing protein [Limnohabitans sp. Rim47]|jgi:hypothetical protein|uniref:DUF4810 domain-containing protein n=1 Tax=Limnohabitans sp. Rim47 TaxID=1100721 RepID=UPI00055D8353|nr:DUF4810 domain-containing protein [Limnohabitans sp. Rim47]
MNQRTRSRLSVSLKTLALLATFLALTGCANKATPTLYGWNSYEKNLDTYFRNDSESLDTQAKFMEDDLQKMRAADKAIPPGYQAHMGLLYGKQGDLARFQQHLQAEKTQFPESETFVDFLLRKFKPN